MISDLVDAIRTRQGLYRFLGGALLAPAEDEFEVLAAAADVLDGRDLDRFAFSPRWHRLRRHFPADISGLGLDVEYVRLFASGMSGALAPPTESYYRVPAKGGGIAEFVAAVQREYRSMGIASVGLEEAPDHVSTEMEVMAYLCNLEADAWAQDQVRLVEDTIALEERFLRRHLCVWIPQFRRRALDAVPTPFYRDVVEAVHAYVVQDADYVQLMKKELVR